MIQVHLLRKVLNGNYYFEDSWLKNRKSFVDFIESVGLRAICVRSLRCLN